MTKPASRITAGDRIHEPNGGHDVLTVHSATSGREATQDVIYVRCTDKPQWSFVLRPSDSVTPA